jgi:hypothetical protein
MGNKKTFSPGCQRSESKRYEPMGAKGLDKSVSFRLLLSVNRAVDAVGAEDAR